MSGNRRKTKSYGNGREHKRKVIWGHLVSGAKTGMVAVLVALMSGGALWAYHMITHWDYFKVADISVKGEFHLMKKDVIRISELSEGMNLLSANISKARKKLIAHPWVADADVRAKLPGNVEIAIREHKPLAIVDLGKRYLLNQDGRIFKELSPADPDNLPVISGLLLSDLGVNRKPRSQEFDAVMEILETGLQPESVIPNRVIDNIQVDRQIGLVLNTDPDFSFGGIKTVKLGYSDFAGKLDSFKNILSYLKKRETFMYIDSIDLNNLDRIVVNMTGESGGGSKLVEADLSMGSDSV